MDRLEKIADTLSKFKSGDATHHRDLCRALADDMGLAGRAREEFLRKSGAF